MTINSIGSGPVSSPLVQPVKETITSPVVHLIKPDPAKAQASERKPKQNPKKDTVTLSNQALQLSRGLVASEES